MSASNFDPKSFLIMLSPANRDALRDEMLRRFGQHYMSAMGAMWVPSAVGTATASVTPSQHLLHEPGSPEQVAAYAALIARGVTGIALEKIINGDAPGYHHKDGDISPSEMRTLVRLDYTSFHLVKQGEVIAAIRHVRIVFGMGLKEAKDFVDGNREDVARAPSWAIYRRNFLEPHLKLLEAQDKLLTEKLQNFIDTHTGTEP